MASDYQTPAIPKDVPRNADTPWGSRRLVVVSRSWDGNYHHMGQDTTRVLSPESMTDIGTQRQRRWGGVALLTDDDIAFARDLSHAVTTARADLARALDCPDRDKEEGLHE